MDQSHIDRLLERYLHLLDEYTQLRRDLSSLQTNAFQCIARSNFSAERGMRYGQDHYDERMQALRRVRIEEQKDGGVPSYQVSLGDEEKQDEMNADEDAGKDDAEIPKEEEIENDDSEQEKQSAPKSKSKDPLRWFGFFVPQPLRTAQSKSIEAVERTIPRLVSVNAELLHVEIEIRRARKKRAKAEAAAEKSLEGGQNPGVVKSVAL